MKKVIIYIHHLQHYRIPIFSLLSESCDLTIVCENASEYKSEEFSFKVKQCSIRKIGPFLIHGDSVRELTKGYDVVISLFNVRCIDLVLLSMLPFRKFSFIYWGIGVTASYTKTFDQKGISSLVRKCFSFFADALVFYSSYPVGSYSKIRKKESIFVANNTIANPYFSSSVNSVRNKILFVGTLYKAKGLTELIDSYYKVNKALGGNCFDLEIVGDGEQRLFLENKVSSLNLNGKVKFHGAIYEQSVLSNLYTKAIVCVSPKQAGLSVLQSMSNSVPFVTTKSAITGGEIFSIKNNNGVILEDLSELYDLLLDINGNADKYIKMGKLARSFYEKYRMPEQMAGSIAKAIKFVGTK